MTRYKKLSCILIAGAAVLLMAGCPSSQSNDSWSSYSWFRSNPNSRHHTQYRTARDGRRAYRPIHVRPSYHHTPGQSPISHKQRDANWIRKQAPGDYTVEVSGDKRSTVSKSLHKSPRTNRSAQFKYRQGDKTKYGGAYGTYKSREEAQRAMEKLPANVRGSAKVKNWGSIQRVAEDEPTKPAYTTPTPQ